LVAVAVDEVEVVEEVVEVVEVVDEAVAAGGSGVAAAPGTTTRHLRGWGGVSEGERSEQ
jgi:hypothetical protein